MSINTLSHMQKIDLVKGLPYVNTFSQACEGCALGKDSREAFPDEKSWRASKHLELPHSDICGPMRTLSFGGTYAHIPNQKRGKLDEKSEKAILVGYSYNAKAYKLYNPLTKKVITSRDVIFDEDKTWEGLTCDEDGNCILDDMHIDQTGHDVDIEQIDSHDVNFDSTSHANTPTRASVPSTSNQTTPNSDDTSSKDSASLECANTKTRSLSDLYSSTQPIRMSNLTDFALFADADPLNYEEACYKQQFGINYQEVFAPVIRLVYIDQPDEYKWKGEEHKVCRLKKALYGLKQAPRAWYSRLEQHFFDHGFKKCISVEIVEDFKNSMKHNIEMSDLGLLHYFLGIEATQGTHYISISQKKYARDLLHRFNMEDCITADTPMEPSLKLSKGVDGREVDSTFYRSLVGCLMYLTGTRPDIMFSVSLVSRFMENPKKEHWDTARRILRFGKGTVNHGITYSSTQDFKLIGFSDNDFGGNIVDGRSTTGYVFNLGSGTVSWQSKKQKVAVLSSTEAEYMALSSTGCQAIWLRGILEELGIPQGSCTQIYCGNKSAIALTRNPVYHERSKHIRIKFYFIRELILSNEVDVMSISKEKREGLIVSNRLAQLEVQTSVFGEIDHRVVVRIKFLTEVIGALRSNEERTDGDSDSASADRDWGRVHEAGSLQSGHTRNVTFKEFMVCQPPSFQGEKDPIISSRWISEVEGEFLTSFCPAEVKIAAMTWEEFKVLFKAEFEPQVELERLTNEFLYMKQTLDNSRFCQNYVANETMKMGIELEHQGKRKKEEHSQFSRTRNSRGLAREQRGRRSILDAPSVAGAIWVSRAAPVKAIEASSAKKVEIPKGLARVFQLTAAEVKVEPEVVIGIFPVNSKPALVLFDMGASKSFFSTSFCKTFSIVKGRLDEPLDVEIIDEKRVIVRDVYRGNEIKLGAVKFCVDLIPIPMREINVVLGMRWLSRHGVWFDCEGQRVKIRNPSGGDLIIAGNALKRLPKTCSLAKARRYVKGGGVSYLVYVTKSAGEKKKKMVADVPMVRDFPDVFPEDLPGVPSEQEVEFGVDMSQEQHQWLKLLTDWHLERCRSCQVSLKSFWERGSYARVVHLGEPYPLREKEGCLDADVHRLP
ncbi:hypothetical protein OSB04_031794 [Centaurea solstitialis]|uniref:Uncharacterized protein n=1 Tax=Centaurea solstitialis TaxID=347529 RepID=A0AA38W8G0_9ASTR|nr:hypothetical protein OSB04_031794 [Centaurea solstitialis]